MLMTIEEFNQTANQVIAKTQSEPVFITKAGEIINVILTYQDYQRQQKESHLSTTAMAKNSKPQTETFASIFGAFQPNMDMDYEFERDKTLPKDVEFI